MNPRTTALLLLAALGLGAFLYFYEIRGESARLDAQEREKRVFRGIEPADVSWIALHTSDGADARFEQRDGKWQIVSPIAFPADAAVGRLAEALATMTSEKTLDHPQPDAEYGLDDAAAKIVRFGAVGAEHTLRIGKAAPIGSNVYARTDNDPAVHMVANYRATAFTHSLAELRDKQIVAFDPSAISEVEARWPGGRVALVRAQPPAAPDKEALAAPAPPSEWRMTAPLEARADGDAVDNLLSTLSFLRADAFIDAPTAAQRKLLEPPDFEVVLKNRDAGQPPISLAVGKPEGERRPVRAAGDVLYEIAATRIADFARQTVAYRERHLARFPATDAQQLDFFFHVPGADPVAIRAERSGESGWTSTPEAFASGKLAAVASELSRLEAADILAESTDEKGLEKLGLSPPNTIITVFGAEPKNPAKAPDAAAAKDAMEDPAKEPGGEALPPAAPRLAEVHLGNVTPKGVVAQAVGDPIVYRIDLETAERLPVSFDAFQSRFRAQPGDEAKPPAPAAEPATEPPPTGEESP